MNKPLYGRVRTPMSESDNQKDKLKLLLSLWNAEFDKLEAKIRKAGADPKFDANEQRTMLRKHCYKAKSKLEAIYAAWQGPLTVQK